MDIRNQDRTRGVRFGALSGGMRTSTFTVSSPDDSCDVYIDCDDASSSYHVSLHASGKDHIAHGSHEDFTGPRIPYRWDRPGPLMGKPKVRAVFGVLLGEAALGPLGNPDGNRPVTWLDLSQLRTQEHWQVTLLLTDPPIERLTFPTPRPRWVPVGAYPLVDGSALWVVAQTAATNPSLEAEVVERFARARASQSDGRLGIGTVWTESGFRCWVPVSVMSPKFRKSA